MLGKFKVHGCSLRLQRFWWSKARNHCKKPRKTTQNHENHQNHCKSQEKPKKNNSIFKLSLKIEFCWFLGFYSDFGGQELETTVKTQEKPPKNTKKHKTTLQKPRKTKNNFVQTISQNRVLVVFLGLYGSFGGQELETTVKTKSGTWGGAKN